MATRNDKHWPEGRRNDYVGGRYGRGHAYGNPDPEYGVDARAYGHYRNAQDSREREYDSNNEGYNGRNASDYNSRSYGDAYYYNPSNESYYYDRNERDRNEDRGAYRSGPSDRYDDERSADYRSSAGRDRDYEQHYRKGDNSGNRNNYSSYPSYGQSWAEDDVDRNARREAGDYSSSGRYTNYGTDRSANREPSYDRYDNRRNDEWENRRRPNIRDRY